MNVQKFRPKHRIPHENYSRLLALTVTLLCLILIIIIWNLNYVQSISEENLEDTSKIKTKQTSAHSHFAFDVNRFSVLPHYKTILLWNTWFWTGPTFFFGTGHQPFIDAKCPVSDCYISNKRYAMPPSEYDAILFFFPMLKSLPFTYSRKENQVYVYVNPEPPIQYTDNEILKDFYGFFNLTMTYRTDSDIHWPYGSVEKTSTDLPREIEKKNKKYAKGKSKIAAWFVSNCFSESHREGYVQELRKHIKVDVYGICGDDPSLQCWDLDECYDMLESDYKFYLSFENSYCRDYVTEKFYEILSRNVVPVVLGAANYSSLAPPGSYIDATRMDPQSLAQLLLKIDRDDELYNQFFKWKRSGN
jgi:alpha-1,3-fucosyltransferase